MAFLELRYFSDALKKHTSANVILPETGTGPYPVLYLLHGLSDDHTAWCRNTSIERYVKDLPLIVVMPDGGRGFYLDAKEGFAFGTAIGTELPERIERTFPAKQTRNGRALAGLSMGGYGALRLALAHPEKFCAAASLSGALGFGSSPRTDKLPEQRAEWERVHGADPTGTASDLLHLTTGAAPETLPALHIDCGVDDYLIGANRWFVAHLTQTNVPHEYVEHPGKHDWAYWDAHIEEAIRFVMAAMETGA